MMDLHELLARVQAGRVVLKILPHENVTICGLYSYDVLGKTERDHLIDEVLIPNSAFGTEMLKQVIERQTPFVSMPGK